MAEFVGTRNCPAFQDVIQDPTQAVVADNLDIAAHNMMGSYTSRSMEARLTPEGQWRAAVNGLLIRSTAVDLVDATFAANEDVYIALLKTVEKDCNGDCANCPFEGTDLTLKPKE